MRVSGPVSSRGCSSLVGPYWCQIMCYKFLCGTPRVFVLSLSLPVQLVSLALHTEPLLSFFSPDSPRLSDKDVAPLHPFITVI